MTYDDFSSVTQRVRTASSECNRGLNRGFGGSAGRLEGGGGRRQPAACQPAGGENSPLQRLDLLQFRPSTDEERELVDEFIYYIAAEGGGWHGSCCFSGV